MNDDTVLTIEDRQYINPQTGLNEQLSFVDTLHDVQAQNTAQINQNTYNLGSQVPSNVGGLAGSERLWQAQYQTPQTNAQVANLRAVAQQQALNQATQNLQGIYQNRYKQALRDYYSRRKAESDAAKARSAATVSNVTEVDPTPDATASLAQGGNAVSGTTMVNIDGNDVYTSNSTGNVLQGGEDQYIAGTGLFGMGGYWLPAGYNADEVRREYDYGLNTVGEVGQVVNYYDKNGNLFAIYDMEHGGWIKK